MSEEIAPHFASWADIGSLGMFILCVWLIGADPEAPTGVWSISKRRIVSQIVAFASSTAWILFRVIFEGIHNETGPREFMLIHISYLTRWAYLKLRMNRYSKGQKLLRVARELRRVQMVRFGKRTAQSDRGKPEVVIRRGCRKAPEGENYWRGVVEFDEFHDDVGIYEVHLLQERLHKEVLDGFGGIAHVAPDMAALCDAYKRFYDVVLTAVSRRRPTEEELAHEEDWNWEPPAPIASTGGTGDPQALRVEVDFRPFTRRWRGLAVEGMASRVEANDPRMIGRVARRIAADAVAYVTDDDNEYEFRTAAQVDALNECLRSAAASVFPDGLLRGVALSDD